MKNKLLLLVTILTFVFCIAIAFDITPYLRGPAPYFPDWRWEYYFVNTLSRIWAPLLSIICILFLSYKTECFSEKQLLKYEKKILLFSIVLLFCLQIAVLYFSRAGVGVLLHRIIHPGANGYFTAATQIQNIHTFISTYNDRVLSLPQHAQGHPPGGILFFYYIEQAIRPFSSLLEGVHMVKLAHSDVGLVWNAFSVSQKVTALFSGLFIPFLSSLTLIPLYYAARYLYSIRIGIRSILLYMTIPSIILFIPINDVFLGLFVMTSFLFFILGMMKRKNYLLLCSGLVFSLGLFFSISILPLLFIFLIYLLFQKSLFTKIILQGSIFSLGIVLLPIIFYVFFGYNSIQVAQTLISGLPEHRAYLTWVFYNLYDFFVFSGVPLLILFLGLLFHICKKTVKKSFTHIDPIAVGFIGMIFILNISGSVRGEVARIWLPFYPFLALVISYFVTYQLKWKKHAFIILLGLQCIQMLVMQEFWVMLW